MKKVESKSIATLDVPTRWSSTYLMLTSALKFQKTFDRLVDDDEPYMIYFSEGDSGKKEEGSAKGYGLG